MADERDDGALAPKRVKSNVRFHDVFVGNVPRGDSVSWTKAMLAPHLPTLVRVNGQGGSCFAGFLTPEERDAALGNHGLVVRGHCVFATLPLNEMKRPSLLMGVFFGTFDPVHEAHVRVAMRAAEVCHLAHVYFVVNVDSPAKPLALPCSARVALLRARLAVLCSNCVCAFAVYEPPGELASRGAICQVLAYRLQNATCRRVDAVQILGADSFYRPASLHKFTQLARRGQLSRNLVVAPRTSARAADVVPAALTAYVTLLDPEVDDNSDLRAILSTSSSLVRCALAENQPTIPMTMLHPVVLAMVRANKWYSRLETLQSPASLIVLASCFCADFDHARGLGDELLVAIPGLTLLPASSEFGGQLDLAAPSRMWLAVVSSVNELVALESRLGAAATVVLCVAGKIHTDTEPTSIAQAARPHAAEVDESMMAMAGKSTLGSSLQFEGSLLSRADAAKKAIFDSALAHYQTLRRSTRVFSVTSVAEALRRAGR